MTTKDIVAAYWREIEKQDVLGPEMEQVAREAMLGVSHSSPPEDCAFIRSKVSGFNSPEHFVIEPRYLPSIEQMLKRCFDFFDPSKRKTVEFTSYTVCVRESVSTRAEKQLALAEAMVLEWRKDAAKADAD